MGCFARSRVVSIPPVPPFPREIELQTRTENRCNRAEAGLGILIAAISNPLIAAFVSPAILGEIVCVLVEGHCSWQSAIPDRPEIVAGRRLGEIA
jgi:hypothetical protein